MATIEDLEKRVELDERYLNAVLRGYESVLRAAEHVLTQRNATANQSAMRDLKDAVRGARKELDSVKARKL